LSWRCIEEITRSYVVIKIWDGRRSIVPMQYFVENSFSELDTRLRQQDIGNSFSVGGLKDIYGSAR